MQNCLGELTMTCCLIYLVDVIVFSKPEEEHLCHLCIVFESFRDHHLKVKLTKCEFFKSKINYLAHHISKDHVWPSNENLKAVAEFVPPPNYTEIWPFLGLVGHYRWFIKGFAETAQPLHEHLSEEEASKKNEWVTFTENVLGAFETLKKACLEPLCWPLLISISHFSWKPMQASSEWELCYHKHRVMVNTIQ